MRKRIIFSLALCLAIAAPLACGGDRPMLADSSATERVYRAVVGRRASPGIAARVAGSADGVATVEMKASVRQTSSGSPVDASAESRSTGFAAPSPIPAAAPFSPPFTDTRSADGAMLIRHGDASVEVRGLGDALAAIRQTAAQFGGFVANTAIKSGRDEQPAATLELRVPAPQFDALLAALGAVGKVESVNATAQDVGEEYTDLGARAANARRVDVRLGELLATRTGKLSDVLTVERELARVREEIERYEARLRYLDRHASLSTLSLAVHEPLPLIDRPRNGPIVEAIGEAWSHVIGIAAWCIASLGVIIPLALLIALAAFVGRRLLRAPGRDGAGVREA